MEERKNRDELVICTKFTCGYKGYALGKTEAANFAGNHKKSLALSLRDSLKKLKTDYVSSYFGVLSKSWPLLTWITITLLPQIDVLYLNWVSELVPFFSARQTLTH